MALKIASIDAGVNTGLVIATVKQQVEYVVLRPELVETIASPGMATVLDALDKFRCRIAVLERMPDYGNKKGMKLYEGTQNYFQEAPPKTHYTDTRSKVLYQVAPGHWKPFMAHRLGLLPECNSQHEKDALAMLFYFIQVNNQGKRVIYE